MTAQSDFLSAMAALRATLGSALRSTDYIIELSSFGPDAKGKERKASLTEIDDLLGVAERCLNVAVVAWPDLAKSDVYCDFRDEDEDDDADDDADDEDED